MKNKTKHSLLKWILLGIFLICLFRLGQAYYQSVSQKNRQEELKELKTAEQEETDTDDSGEDAGKETEPVILEKYRELYEVNHDMAGWIMVEGMNIDYPVLQCSDMEYYLNHDFYGEESKFGCLCVKEEADLADGTNFVIYGHNMKDGAMFGDLEQYQTEEFYQADTQEEFDDFYSNIKKLSLYDTDIEAAYGDVFLTLSTCTCHVEDGRFVVVAKRVS